jgi:DNA-binding XRE family transcriptional regulator
VDDSAVVAGLMGRDTGLLLEQRQLEAVDPVQKFPGDRQTDDAAADDGRTNFRHEHPSIYRIRDIIDGMSTEPRRTAFPGLEHLSGRRRALLDELVATRLEHGLTQTDIAAQMGTSQSAIARLERGDIDPRFSTLERYAAAVGRTVDWTISAQRESSP